MGDDLEGIDAIIGVGHGDVVAHGGAVPSLAGHGIEFHLVGACLQAADGLVHDGVGGHFLAEALGISTLVDSGGANPVALQLAAGIGEVGARSGLGFHGCDVGCLDVGHDEVVFKRAVVIGLLDGRYVVGRLSGGVEVGCLGGVFVKGCLHFLVNIDGSVGRLDGGSEVADGCLVFLGGGEAAVIHHSTLQLCEYRTVHRLGDKSLCLGYVRGVEFGGIHFCGDTLQLNDVPVGVLRGLVHAEFHGTVLAHYHTIEGGCGHFGERGRLVGGNLLAHGAFAGLGIKLDAGVLGNRVFGSVTLCKGFGSEATPECEGCRTVKFNLVGAWSQPGEVLVEHVADGFAVGVIPLAHIDGLAIIGGHLGCCPSGIAAGSHPVGVLGE